MCAVHHKGIASEFSKPDMDGALFEEFSIAMEGCLAALFCESDRDAVRESAIGSASAFTISDTADGAVGGLERVATQTVLAALHLVVPQKSPFFRAIGAFIAFIPVIEGAERGVFGVDGFGDARGAFVGAATGDADLSIERVVQVITQVAVNEKVGKIGRCGWRRTALSILELMFCGVEVGEFEL